MLTKLMTVIKPSFLPQVVASNTYLLAASREKLIHRNNTILLLYSIAGKFGGELNLAVWRSTFATAKLKSANISYLYNNILYIW